MAVLLDIPVELAGGHRCWSDAEHDPRATGVAVEALAYFKMFLGDPWDGWERGVPLVRDFFMSYQGLEPEGVKLYRMVSTLDSVRGLGEIVKSLAREARSEYVAAMMALEFCSRVRASGGDAEFVSRVNVPTPDVHLKLVERWVTTEFKALHEHDEMQRWYEFEKQLMPHMTPRELHAVTFDRELTDAALGDPEAVAEGLAAVAAGKHREYQNLPYGTGRARLAAINCGKCGYPVEQQDDLVRLVSKLRQKWWKQVAAETDHPTLIVVRSPHIFERTSPASVGRAARRIANALGPHLLDFPMIGGVLVYDEPFLPPVSPVFADAGDVRLRIDTSSGCARMMALVPNPAASVPLTEPELSRLVGPEIIW